MEKAEEIGAREVEKQHISMQVSKIPRDLLHRLMNGNHLCGKKQQQSEEEEEEEETEEIELSLGLSLNGRFGVDPTRDNKLTRSSSIPEFMNHPAAKDNNNDSAFMVPISCTNIIRTCSLPMETEEDWRKRKELQTLRRMEAKRKRSEKQRNLKIARQRSSRVFGEENAGEESVNGVHQLENSVPFGLPSWVNGVKGPAAIVRRAAGDGAGAGAGVEGCLPPPPAAVVASQGSIGSSQVSGSSSISEFESQPSQGLSKCSEAISSSNFKLVQKGGQKLIPHSEATNAEKTSQFIGVAMENEPNKRVDAEKGVREVVRNVLEDMPGVSTKGDGPNGKRIEGFLYRYKKGEEVKIVCVCHGSFLSPAEFVKHAGGGDVAHPLKHIVVNPTTHF